VVIIVEKKLLKSLNRLEWGGPAITFRWDGLTKGDIKYASVRALIPPTPPT
jgi:hypothetical protein